MNSLVKAIHLSSFVLQILAKKFDPTRFSTEKSAPCPHMARTPSPSPQADQRRKSSAMGIQRNPYGVYIYTRDIIKSYHRYIILYYVYNVCEWVYQTRTQWIDMDYKSLWKWMDDPQYRVQQGMFRPWHSAPSRSPALKSDAPGIPLGSNSNDKSPIILKMGRYIISGVMGVPQSHPMVDHRFPKKNPTCSSMNCGEPGEPSSSAKPRSSSRVAALVHKLEPWTRVDCCGWEYL